MVFFFFFFFALFFSFPFEADYTDLPPYLQYGTESRTGVSPHCGAR